MTLALVSAPFLWHLFLTDKPAVRLCRMTAASPFITVDKRPAGYAVVTFVREPANIMDLGFWQQLATVVRDLEADPKMRGTIFCSGLKRDIFTAGAKGSAWQQDPHHLL